MDNIYTYKYHVAWEDEREEGTGEGFVFATDYSAACEELKKMYGSYITKLYLKEVSEPDCYVFETKADGKEVTGKWDYQNDF